MFDSLFYLINSGAVDGIIVQIVTKATDFSQMMLTEWVSI